MSVLVMVTGVHIIPVAARRVRAVSKLAALVIMLHGAALMERKHVLLAF